MPVFQTEKDALAYMATQERGTGMADDTILDWKERAQDLQGIGEDIAKAKRHYKLLADMEPDLGTRVLETYNALGDLEGTRTAMEQANGVMQAENERLDAALAKKRETVHQEIATLDRTLKETKQAHILAVGASTETCDAALAADLGTIETSRQKVVQTLAGHALQKQEADKGHAEVMRGHAEAEASAKLATVEAEKLRAQLTALRG